MDMYECACRVYEYLDDDGYRHHTYDILRYIEAEDEYEAMEKLVEWVQNIWPQADIDEITAV